MKQLRVVLTLKGSDQTMTALVPVSDRDYLTLMTVDSKLANEMTASMTEEWLADNMGWSSCQLEDADATGKNASASH